MDVLNKSFSSYAVEAIDQTFRINDNDSLGKKASKIAGRVTTSVLMLPPSFLEAIAMFVLAIICGPAGLIRGHSSNPQMKAKATEFIETYGRRMDSAGMALSHSVRGVFGQSIPQPIQPIAPPIPLNNMDPEAMPMDGEGEEMPLVHDL